MFASFVIRCTGTKTVLNKHVIVTFRVSHRRRKSIVVTRVCVCVCVCVSVCLSVCLTVAACLQYCTDPDVTWGSGRGCLQVVHYWADFQSVHGLRCV